MRHGRSKAARKTLAFFSRTAGINAPYHILLDGTFMVAVVKYNFPLRERLDKILQHAAFTLYTTKSVLEELEALKAGGEQEKQKQQLLGETLQFARQECELVEGVPDLDKETKDWLNTRFEGFEEMLSPPGMDFLKLSLPSKDASKATNYFVACHDESLLDILRNAGIVPCVRLARGSVLLLENPSKSGQRQATHEERKKWAASGSVREEEKRLVEVVRAEKRNQRDNNTPQQQQSSSSSSSSSHMMQHKTRQKRKAKEPNPLSCKKKKPTNDDSSNKKRRRRRKTSNAEGTAQD